MAETSLFFDSSQGDKAYYSTDFAKFFKNIVVTDGVIRHVDNELIPVLGSGMNILIGTGAAWIQGRCYYNETTSKVLPIAAADKTDSRIDRVVIRLDLNFENRNITTVVKTGTPSASPAPPSLQRDNFIWELSICQFTVVSNATAPSSLIDERTDSTLCGYYPAYATQTTEGLMSPSDKVRVDAAASTSYVDTELQNVNSINTDALNVVKSYADNSATVAANNALTSANQYADARVSPHHNYIINGNFDVWQRGSSLASDNTGLYRFLADRWQTVGSGSSIAISRQQFALGQTDVPNEPTYFHRCVVSSVAGAANRVMMYQSVESVRTLANKTVTYSFYAKADSAKTIAIELTQQFGSGGSTSVSGIGITKINLTTSWQKFSVVFSVPSISGKTIGTDSKDALSIVIWFDAGSNYASRTNSLGQQSGTFDIAQVQLEEGSIATKFEILDYGDTLRKCQRYYEIIYASVEASTTAAGYYVSCTVSFHVEKRVVPTITLIVAGTRVNVAGAPYPIAYQQSVGGCVFSIKSLAAGDTYCFNDVYGIDSEL